MQQEEEKNIRRQGLARARLRKDGNQQTADKRILSGGRPSSLSSASRSNMQACWKYMTCWRSLTAAAGQDRPERSRWASPGAWCSATRNSKSRCATAASSPAIHGKWSGRNRGRKRAIRWVPSKMHKKKKTYCSAAGSRPWQARRRSWPSGRSRGRSGRRRSAPRRAGQCVGQEIAEIAVVGEPAVDGDGACERRGAIHGADELGRQQGDAFEEGLHHVGAAWSPGPCRATGRRHCGPNRVRRGPRAPARRRGRARWRVRRRSRRSRRKSRTGRGRAPS